MRIVVAPDGFGGTLEAQAVAEAIAVGWSRVRQDTLVLQPMSDGGEGLLGVVARENDSRRVHEVAGPLGHPVEAAFLRRSDGTVVIESALACGLNLLRPEERDPQRTTTYGVGELIAAAHAEGTTRILVGLGGSATVDGGAGALQGLGFRLLDANGDGIKIGGGELERVAHARRGAAPDMDAFELVMLSDVVTTLGEAAAVFGPQKGADAAAVTRLAAGLDRWADVAERDLHGGTRLRDDEGTGAAGGLGFGLACAYPTRFISGVEEVAKLTGTAGAIAGADLVITGEGRLDATSTRGKVVGWVLAHARDHGVPVAAVVGQRRGELAGLVDVEESAPDGPGQDVVGEVAAAAQRLAARWSTS